VLGLQHSTFRITTGVCATDPSDGGLKARAGTVALIGHPWQVQVLFPRFSTSLVCDQHHVFESLSEVPSFGALEMLPL